nr:DUF6879 family protein [Spongiactinospora rosea]
MADEIGPFQSWLKGEPDDHRWHDSWLRFVRAAVGRGTSIQRARVVTEPWSDYVRWAMTIDPLNLEAGEEIGYLPRQTVADISLPDEDYWLIDDDTLVLSLFEPDGSSGGLVLVRDEALINQCVQVRDLTWPRAVPYVQYVAA